MNDGAASGGFSFGPAEVREGVSFALGSRMNTNSRNAFSTAAFGGGITIDAWIRVDPGTTFDSTSPPIVATVEGAYALRLTQGGQVGAAIDGGGIDVFGGPDIRDGLFHLIAFTARDASPPQVDSGADQTVFEGTEVSFVGAYTDSNLADVTVYVDGISVANGSSSFYDIDTIDRSSFSVGNHPFTDHDLPNTRIDEVELFNRELPQSEIRALYDAADAGKCLTAIPTVTLPTIQIVWDFGDGTGATGTLTPTHVYADNGVRTVALTVSDAAGNVGVDSLQVTVLNVAPTVASSSEDFLADEGQTVSFTANAHDPGFDFAPAGTLEDFTATVDWDDGTVDPVALTETPGAAGSPTSVTLAALTHIYGDDGNYSVVVTVCDDDGGCGSDTLLIRVGNLDPSLLTVTATGTAGARLRVAGEKWHDVCIELYQGGAAIASGCVLRVPGSPDDQSLDLGTFTFDFTQPLTARVVYTPMDDTVNGQVWGADPAWVIFTRADGTESRIHHTFNVRHPDTWLWEPDLIPTLAALGIDFTATATDPGSDDLTFAWDFGDGTTAVTTHFNDGIGPDPLKSPFGTFPFAATGTDTHVYATSGTYAVTLTVLDDDGGTAAVTLVVGS